MAKYDNEDGVWRTIGGRRVFIKTGQSLEEAMKESGKFKSTKKDDGDENPPSSGAKKNSYIDDIKNAKDFNELRKIASNIEDEKTRNDVESRLFNLQAYKYDEPGKLEEAKKYLNDDYEKIKKGEYKNLGSKFEYKKEEKSIIHQTPEEAKAKLDKDEIEKKFGEINKNNYMEAQNYLVFNKKMSVEESEKILGNYEDYLDKDSREFLEKNERLNKAIGSTEGRVNLQNKANEVVKGLKETSSSKTYKSKDELEEMVNSRKKLGKDIDSYYKQSGTETGLTEKARQEIISGYDNYDDAISNFAEEHDIPRYRAEEYFEKARKKLGITTARLKGEEESGVSSAINDKIRERARRSQEKQKELQKKVASSGDDVAEEMRYADDRATFRKISKTYGYDNLSDNEIKEVLDFAEKRGLYHSKEEIATMRRYLDSRVLRNEFDTYKKEHPDSKMSFTEWKKNNKK